MSAASVPNAEPPPLTMVSLGDSLTAGTQDGVTQVQRQRMVYTKQLADRAGLEFNLPEIADPGIPFQVFAPAGFDLGAFTRLKKTLMTALAPLATWTYYLGAPPFLYPPVVRMLGGGYRLPESRTTDERPQHSFAVAGFEARHVSQVRDVRDFMGLIHERTEPVAGLAQQVPLVKATLQNGACRTLGSQLEQAVRARPDLVVLWAGSNDALEAAFEGRIDDRTLTPVEDRRWNFQDPGLIGKGKWRTSDEVQPGFRSTFVGEHGLLTTLLQETEAEIMLLNIPDVNVVPNLLTLGRVVGALPFRVLLSDGSDVTPDLERFVIPNRVLGQGKSGRRYFPPGSKVPLVTLLGKLVSGGPLESRRHFDDALDRVLQNGLLEEDEVLDPEEAARVQARIDEFNAVLSQAAAENSRIHLVDLHGMLNEVRHHGRSLVGDGVPVTVTTTWTGVKDERGFGGIFSYDGVHPSDTGHAVVANLLLDKIKQDLGHDPRFGALVRARSIDEKAVYQADPHQDGRSVLVLERSTLESLGLSCR